MSTAETTRNPDGSIRMIKPPRGTISVEELLLSTGWQRMIDAGELTERKKAPSAHVGFFSLDQRYEGLHVIGGRLSVRSDKAGKVILAQSSLARWQARPTPEFRISFEEAVTLAEVSSKPQTMVTKPLVDRVILPRTGVPVACYRVKVTLASPTRAMEYFFDAVTGYLLLAEDHLKRYDGAGFVFNPDPKSALGDDDLEDADDDSAAIPAEAYSEVALLEISYDQDSLLVLTGPYVDTSPTRDRFRSENGQFFFDRSNDHFEEVMAYYHLDHQARYILDIGFINPPYPVSVEVNGLADDASFFNPQTGTVTTGTGGVDDAEDADVLIHEYTHAVIESVTPDWRGGETSIIAEGICDYFAGDYSLAATPDFEPMQIYNWDGHNEFWEGRILDSDYHYPEDCQGDIHDAGQIYSSLLTEVRLSGDRDRWNSVVLLHFYEVIDSLTLPDMIWVLLSEESLLTDGEFRAAIVTAAERRGLAERGEYGPVVTHLPPRDSENIDSATTIEAEIISDDHDFGLNYDSLMLIYRFDENQPETLSLNYVRNSLFQAEIPAPGRETEVTYYLFAADETGVSSCSPADAPAEWHRFHIGPDHIPPVIVEIDRLPDTVFPIGNARFGVTVQDNIGVDSVVLLWFDDEGSILGESELEPGDSADVFLGEINWNADRDETILYRIRATDLSGRNFIQSAYRSFTIRTEATIDDFEHNYRNWSATTWVRHDRSSYAGNWSFRDRSELDFSLPRTSTAEFNNFMHFAGMEHARFRFAERHIFSNRGPEYAVVELLEEGSEDWYEVFRTSGSHYDWIEREVNLDYWAMRNSPPIKLRFRTVTPEGSNRYAGWYIDDLRLLVRNSVTADSVETSITPSFDFSGPFPNPTNSSVTFRVTSQGETRFSLVDLTGREVRSFSVAVGEQVIELGLDQLSAGIYWLEAGTHDRIRRRILLVK